MITNNIQYIFIKILQKILKGIEKLKFPNSFCNFLNKIIDYFIQKSLKNYFEISYQNLNENNIGNKNSEIIWMFWWQGSEQMPMIVKKCINSVIKNSNKRKVILITKNNIKKYTDIPSYIYEKLKLGNITLTHFSDILRMNLLKKYGGLWVDATMYCSTKISDSYFDYLYTSGKYEGTIPKFVKGRWTGFLIGGNAYNSLFIFMDNYFKEYWKSNNHQLDYFLIDYGLHYAYLKNIGGFREYINHNDYNNNPCLFDLRNHLNNPFNKNDYKRLTKNTQFFKLSYKDNLNERFKNKKTFYYKLIHDKIY